MPDASDAVELTRGLVEAQGVEATMHFFGPHSVYDLSAVGLQVLDGAGAIRAFLEEWLSSYEETADELEEATDLGSGVVLAVIRGRGRPRREPARGRGPGAPLRRGRVGRRADRPRHDLPRPAGRPRGRRATGRRAGAVPLAVSAVRRAGGRGRPAREPGCAARRRGL